jgi:hypothetical protein
MNLLELFKRPSAAAESFFFVDYSNNEKVA